MDKLGGKTWEKKKERARKKVMQLAEKLVALYAGRKWHGFSPSALIASSTGNSTASSL